MQFSYELHYVSIMSRLYHHPKYILDASHFHSLECTLLSSIYYRLLFDSRWTFILLNYQSYFELMLVYVSLFRILVTKCQNLSTSYLLDKSIPIREAISLFVIPFWIHLHILSICSCVWCADLQRCSGLGIL